MRLKNNSTMRSRASQSQFSKKDFKDESMDDPPMNKSFNKDELVNALNTSKQESANSNQQPVSAAAAGAPKQEDSKANLKPAAPKSDTAKTE